MNYLLNLHRPNMIIWDMKWKLVIILNMLHIVEHMVQKISKELVPGEYRTETLERPEPPDRTELLPKPIRKYTKRFVYDSVDNHLSFEQGGGHHGSHPHLVNEFVSSIIEGRQPWIDAVTSATWTAAGICAHKSAMMNGTEIMVPKFDD